MPRVKIPKKLLAGGLAAVIFIAVFPMLFPAHPQKSESAALTTGEVIAKNAASPDSRERIQRLFLCPCCSMTIDSDCCEMSGEMIDFIDSQIDGEKTEDEVILEGAKKYGLTSLVESERPRMEKLLESRSPEIFPEGRISFSSAVGSKAPDFSLEGLDGKARLSDFRGKNVVLFFNEGSMCYPACWNQIASLGNDDRFNSEETVAFSVVADQKSVWQDIRARLPEYEKAKILFDTARTVSSAYDVLSLQSSMHKGSSPGHTYFIIDKEGIIRYALDDPSMAIRNDLLYSEIREFEG